MPYAKRSKKSYKKRSKKYKGYGRKKYTKKYPKGMGKPSNPVVFPQCMYRTFTYSTDPQFLAQTTTQVPANYLMAGNDMYDPDPAIGGHQPKWYDTLLGAPDGGSNAPYSRYQVNASKITVTIWQDPKLTGTSGSVDGIATLIPVIGGGSQNLPQNFISMRESQNVRLKYIGNANSSRPLVLKHFAKTKMLWQCKSINDNQDFSGAYNGSPNNKFTWALQICNVNSGTGTNLFSCWYTIKVKYYAKLWFLNTPPTS